MESRAAHTHPKNTQVPPPPPRITARRIIIFRQTAPGHICSLFLSFSKSGRRNNAKSAFQYTVNNNTTQYAKKKKKKRKNKYGPLRRYSRLITYPVLNPDRQGLTWVPLPNQVSRGYCEKRISSFTHRNVNSQFKNNLREKAKADTQTPNSRPGRDIHYNRNGRFHTREGLFVWDGLSVCWFASDR